MKKIKFQKYTTSFELNLLDDIDISENEIEKIIDDFELSFSRFKDNSELSLINKNGGGNVSPLFLRLLKINFELYYLSNGYFNPLVSIENIGYSDKKIKLTEKINDNLDENIIISGDNIKIKNNLKLDFGGSAKGFIVDLISEYLKEKGAKNYYINFGGDIYFSGTNKDNLWKVSIDNPFFKNKSLGIINIENKSISSSGSYKRNWDIEGKNYHHILNPKTNKNENEIIMVSIISDRTYFSDAIATSIFSMGIKSALDFLNNNSIDGIVIGNNKKAYFSKGFIGKYNFKK